MTRTCVDPLYWLSQHPADWFGDDTIAVLRNIEGGYQDFCRDRLEVAFLIAKGCVKADCDKHTLTITDKGRDALAFYTNEP
jgi:hypothetical protein